MGSLTRKDFLQKLAAGSIGSFSILSGLGNKSKAATPSSSESLGVALMGLGGYSRGQLAPALQETNDCHLAGIISGTPEKQQVWAEKYGLPDKSVYNYRNMDEIANNDDIDIVYNVLPNAMHAMYSIKAAEAGKHVMCEKPMTTTVEDAQRIIDACNKNNVKLSIGYRLHFDPFNKKMMEYGQQQKFGKVKKVSAGFGFPFRGRFRWRLDRFMAGGGSLMDLGIYSVQGLVYTMGEIPESVEAEIVPNDDPLFREVESHIKWTFQFPSGAIGEGESSYSDQFCYLEAEAEDGTFGLEPSFFYGGIKGYLPKGSFDVSNVNQQARQMDDFARRVKNDTQTPVPGEMGLRDMVLIEAIYEAAETGETVKIDPVYDVIDSVSKE